jgi:YaiO family outer membrane protein
MKHTLTTNGYMSVVIAVLIASLPLPVFAAEQHQYIEANYIEGGLDYSDLDHGYADWKGVFVRGSWQQNSKNVWAGELLHKNEYNAWGNYLTAGLTHTFNDDWYGSLSAGVSDGAFFFNKYQVDGFINRKLLKDRNLVATLGVGYDEAKHVNADSYIYLGASYYFDEPWLLEGGIRLNRSTPGPENSHRYRIAVTYGRAFDQFIIADFDWGTEAYQFVSTDVSIVNFNSRILSLTWRKWIAKDWGLAMRGEFYQSDEYNRNGVEVSVFKHF